MTNTQPKHTPGPWKAFKASIFCDAPVRSSYCLAKAERNPTMRVSEQEANARLIAAAPDMKELLEEIHHAEVFFQSACIARDFIDADKWERARKEALAKIPAAIAKATGAL